MHFMAKKFYFLLVNFVHIAADKIKLADRMAESPYAMRTRASIFTT